MWTLSGRAHSNDFKPMKLQNSSSWASLKPLVSPKNPIKPTTRLGFLKTVFSTLTASELIVKAREF